jgi:hypothetical protein
MKKASIIRPFGVGSKDKSQSQSSDLSYRNKLEDILSYFIDEKGTCKKCGRNHSCDPKYENVRTSIDIIPELIRRGNF